MRIETATSDQAIPTASAQPGPIAQWLDRLPILAGVTVPLYDGGVRDARLRDARDRTDASDASLVRLQQGAVPQIVAADDALRSNLAAHRAATALVQASMVSADAALSAYKAAPAR